MALARPRRIMCAGAKRTAVRSRCETDLGGDVTTLTDRIPHVGPRLERVRDGLAEKAERYPAGPRTYVRAAALYLGFMAAWTYGFANASYDLPGPLVFVLLVLPCLLHAGVGFAVGRHEALWLAAFPPALAFFAPGMAPVLAFTLVLLMIFPGAPLLLLGIVARRWAEPHQVEDWF
jgi:hypothetical protein